MANRTKFKWNLPYLWDGQDESEPEIVVSYVGTHEEPEPDTNSPGGELIEDIRVVIIDDPRIPLIGIEKCNIFDDLTGEVAKGIEEACLDNWIERQSYDDRD